MQRLPAMIMMIMTINECTLSPETARTRYNNSSKVGAMTIRRFNQSSGKTEQKAVFNDNK